MSTTITYDGGQTLRPNVVNITSVTAASRARVVSHDVLDGPPVHTLRPAAPARGELELLFYSETAARDCFEAHRLAAVFTMESTDRALLNVKYIVTDDIDVTLDRDTASHWKVTVRYEAVL